jgi:hypothetical protein
MPKHENYEPEQEPEKIDASAGFEKSDIKVTGILVFLTAMFVFVAVVGVLSYGIGKVLNARMNKQDGPNTRWTRTTDVRQLGNMPSSPELQNKVAELTQQFPTPRVQTDDGNQDVADLHQRENLLLENYTWADAAHTKVRIPIERAMEIVARQGIQVAPAAQLLPPMTGDARPVVTTPLTNGFAPTAFEQEQQQQAAMGRKRGE